MPYNTVKEFEKTIADYCGSKYAVAVSSCTNAIFLSLSYWHTLEWRTPHLIKIPHRTYVGVGFCIYNCSFDIEFSKRKWKGSYELKPTKIIDSALRFKKNMHKKGNMTCISFHNRKHIPIGRGGMILTDDKKAYDWLKLARFDGREEKPLKEQKEYKVIGWNMYMSPEQAARGLVLFNNIKNKDLPDIDDYDTYPDLSKLGVFK